jgi:hypothetical protein
MRTRTYFCIEINEEAWIYFKDKSQAIKEIEDFIYTKVPVVLLEVETIRALEENKLYNLKKHHFERLV